MTGGAPGRPGRRGVPGHADGSGPGATRGTPGHGPGAADEAEEADDEAADGRGRRRAGGLRGSREVLATVYDVALLDLDGVVYVGSGAVPHAAQALAAAAALGLRRAFVTNNALRTPAEVAEHLTRLGVPAATSDVVTSAQAAARLLAERLPAGARVLVSGGRGLREAVAERGLVAVAHADDTPQAVVAGYDPELDYARLSEAALAVRAGALFVATNADVTVPSSRGLLPGNGALVALLVAATGREPLVAGKPERALHEESVRRTQARNPLVVGDRLDTDIEGAVRRGTDALLVLTGVTSPQDLLRAGHQERPTYVAADARGLLRAAPDVTVHQARELDAECGAWRARLADGRMAVRRQDDHTGRDEEGADDGLDVLRVVASLTWKAHDLGLSVTAFDPAPAELAALGVQAPDA